MLIQTKKEAGDSDNYAMTVLGIPSQILMENAARSFVDILSEKVIKQASIGILCGSGNNGGDGFAAARHLLSSGFRNVKILTTADTNKMSSETLQNYRICLKLNIETIHIQSIDDFNAHKCGFDCIIDALIGVGGNENLKGIVVDILKEVNNLNVIKVAMDIPAGLNADTGKSHTDAFKAALTITMFAPKIGMFLNNGPDICGEIKVASLGFPFHFCEKYSSGIIYRREDVRKILKPRKNNSSKFDYGKVLILAGSEMYPGAAALAANAAVRAGAGLVYLASTFFDNSLFPEVIRIKLKSDKDGFIDFSNKKLLEEYFEKCDAIAIGPGLGNAQDTIFLVKELIKKYNYKKIVLDADGLKAVSKSDVFNNNLILTPHIYEFSKITGLTSENIKNDEYNHARNISLEMKCIIHLKSVPSITSNGVKQALTINGNPGMASGGSGDVLTGIIVGLLGIGLNTFDAASLGAYLHAAAGDYYVKSHSQESLKAGDLIEQLAYVLD